MAGEQDVTVSAIAPAAETAVETAAQPAVETTSGRRGAQGPRVLIACGSKNGGTAQIAEWIGAAMKADGLDVVVQPAGKVRSVAGFDAVVLGGALYANRWHPDARRFGRRHARRLRGRPVWLFSSGPLDRTAEERDIGPVPGAAKVLGRLGARGHITFGGCLGPDSRGWIAKKMVQNGRGGDFRAPERVKGWAHSLAAQIKEQAGRSRQAAGPGAAA